MILDFVKQGATYDLFEVFSPYCGLGYNDPKNGFIPLQPEMNIVIGMEKYENFVDKLIASTREKGAAQYIEYVAELKDYAERNRKDWAEALDNEVVKARMEKHLHFHSEK
jgi:formate dehydrogenase maturation protein FdhE